MTDTPTPPDGWYPDPAGGGGLRRWNGTSWTDEVRSADGGQPAQAASEQHDAGAVSRADDEPAGAHGSASAEAHPPAVDSPSEGSSPKAQSSAAGLDDGSSSEAAPATEGSSHGISASLDPQGEPVASTPAETPAASPVEGPAEGPAQTEYTAPGASVPPVTPPAPAAPADPPAAPAYTSAPAFSSAPSYPSAPAYGAGAAAAGAGYSATPGYPSAPPVAYDTAAPRRDIKTNTVWVWLMVFLPLLSLLGIIIFDWSSYFRDAFYADVYSYDSGPASMTGINAATGLLTGVTSVVSIVVSALTVLFAFLDWRQLRARGVDRPFHWAFSFFVLAIGSGLVYIIGRGVVLRRRTGSGLAPIWASIAVNVVVVIGFIIWAVVLISQLVSLGSEFSSSYGY